LLTGISELRKESDFMDIENDPEAMPANGSRSHDDDDLMDDLLANNPEFQALVEKSKASPRKPFAASDAGAS
jgi:hypothetical protein